MESQGAQLMILVGEQESGTINIQCLRGEWGQLTVSPNPEHDVSIQYNMTYRRSNRGFNSAWVCDKGQLEEREPLGKLVALLFYEQVGFKKDPPSKISQVRLIEHSSGSASKRGISTDKSKNDGKRRTLPLGHLRPGKGQRRTTAYEREVLVNVVQRGWPSKTSNLVGREIWRAR